MIGAVSAATDNLDDVVKSDATHKDTIKHTHTTTTDTSSEKIVEKTNTDTINEKKSINNDKKEEKEEDEVEVNKLSTTPNNDLLKEGTDNGTFTTLNKNNDKDTLKETQPINNWTDLKKAINNGTEDIKLTNNITTNGEYIIINGKVRINGDGHTIDAEKTGIGGIFNLGDGASLILENLKIINDQTISSGGAISTGANCNLTVTNCTFNQNTANHYGGAISTGSNCNLTVTNCTFKQNTANSDGGAIYTDVNCKLTVTNCTFKQNTATRSGGAISTGANCDLTVTNCTFNQNTAEYGGGAIYTGDNCKLTVTNCTFNQNTVNDGYGGAINTGANCNLTVTNCTFNQNTATQYSGGAISTDSNCDVNVDNALFCNNNAKSGDGIDCSGGSGTRIIKNSAFINDGYKGIITEGKIESINDDGTSFRVLNAWVNYGNPYVILTKDYTYSTSDDGEDYKNGVNITRDVTINGNGHTISGNQEARIFKITKQTKATITNTTLTKGKGQEEEIIFGRRNVGGAIYIDNATVTIINTTLQNNTATEFGGAIYTNLNSNINITNSILQNNQVPGDAGGAISVCYSNITINNSTLQNNHAYDGGAIHAYESRLNITTSTLTNNTATYDGGAITASTSNVTIINTTLQNNTATEFGGAIIGKAYSNISITTSTLQNNQATGSYGRGGAITASTSNVTIINTTLQNNHATGPNSRGGAIYTESNSQINITNSTLQNNHATEFGGVIFAAFYSKISVTSNLFLGNSANSDGSAIYGKWFADLTVNHNIFLNNTRNNIIYLVNDTDDDYKFDYNLDYNWFDNTADNYTNKPNIIFEGIDEPKFDNWLFLNAIADPNPVQVLNTTNITFKLSLYNSSSKRTDLYDNSQLKPVNLTITHTNGIVDKDIAKLNETIEYTPKNIGTGSVTARISNAEYTINLTVTQIPTNITVNTDPITLNVTDTSKITATLEPSDAGSLTYNSSNKTIVTVDNNGNLKAISQGIANITVSFAGQGNYAAATSKIIQVIVNLKDASVSVNNATLDLFIGDEFTIVTTTTPDLNVTYIPDDSGIVTVDENGKITALKEGTAQITVKINGKGIYFENSTTVNVTVSKIPTTINLTQNSFTLTVDDNVDASASLTPPEAGNLTYTSNDTNVAKVVNGKIIAVGPGSAKITVSFTGNQKYAAANKTIKVTVNSKPTPSPEPTINPNKKTVYEVKIYLTLKKVKKISKKTRRLYLKVIVKRNGKKILTKKITIKVKRNKVKAKKTNKNKAKSKKLSKVQGFKFTVKINGKTYSKKTNKKGKITYTINNLYNKGTYKAKISYKSKYYKKNGKNIKFKIKA